MSNETLPTDDPATDTADERKLRGIALNGPEQKAAVDHSEYEGKRIRCPVEAQFRVHTLYRDGIDIEGDFDTPAGTSGSSGTIP